MRYAWKLIVKGRCVKMFPTKVAAIQHANEYGYKNPEYKEVVYGN